jgi:flagellar biosynthetic protein FliO
VGLSKGKLVILIAGGLLTVNLLWPAVLLAGGLQGDTKAGFATEQKDINLLNQPDSAPSAGSTSSGQASSPQSGSSAVSSAEVEIFYKMLLSVIVVIALGVAVVYVSKKVLPRFTNLPGKQIRVIESTHIAPRKGLHLVQVGARRLLIASTNEQITMLADVTDSGEDFASQLEVRCKDK